MAHKPRVMSVNDGNIGNKRASDASFCVGGINTFSKWNLRIVCLLREVVLKCAYNKWFRVEQLLPCGRGEMTPQLKMNFVWTNLSEEGNRRRPARNRYIRAHKRERSQSARKDASPLQKLFRDCCALHHGSVHSHSHLSLHHRASRFALSRRG